MTGMNVSAMPQDRMVWIEAMRDFLGYTTHAMQPSVGVLLRVAGPVPVDSSARLGAAFDGLTIAPFSADTPSDHQLASAIATLVADLMVQQGVPVLCPAGAIRLNLTSFRLTLPTIGGAHHLTQRLAAEVVDLVDQAVRETCVRGLSPERLLRITQAIRREAPRGRNTLPMLHTAHLLGIPWNRVANNVYCFGQGAKSRWFDSSLTDDTPAISVRLAKQKNVCAAILRRHGLPVPRHHLASDEVRAVAAAESIGYPVVVKPADQDRGIGVAAGLVNAAQVVRAFVEASRHSKAVLVEKHVDGGDYRVHVFQGEVYKVRHRIPGGVVGDGRSSVAELLQSLNSDPRRGPPGTDSKLFRIDLDTEALELLQERQLGTDSVPQEGTFVQLRRIANVSVGGVSLPVDLSQVHPDNLALARQAVRALKLDLAAVDLLIRDIGRSWRDVEAGICEVNAQPQFGVDAPEWLFTRIFPGQGRIPMIAVVGDCGCASWIEQVVQAVAARGKRLGFCDPQQMIDESGSRAGLGGLERRSVADVCLALAGDSEIDAMLVVADVSLLEQGTPTNRFDALVVTGKGALQRYEVIAVELAMQAGQVFLDATTEDWRKLRDKIGGDACLELKPRGLVDQLVGILTRE